MSVHALAWAFEQEIEPSGRKFVLVALADHADAQGRCYPSQVRLAFMTGQGVRTVRRHLADLEELGFITRAETRRESDGGRTSDTVWLNAPPERLDPSHGATEADDRVPTKRPTTPPAKMARGVPPGQNGQGGAAKMARGPRPNWPGINHQLEPSEGSGGHARKRARPNHHSEDEEKQKILTRAFGNLLATLLAEQPQRRVRWPTLELERIQAAHTTAQEDVITQAGSFATHFKTRLDQAAGLAQAPAAAAQAPDPAVVEERKARHERATRAQEAALDQALEEGHDAATAERLSVDAYYRALGEDARAGPLN